MLNGLSLSGNPLQYPPPSVVEKGTQVFFRMEGQSERDN